MTNWLDKAKEAVEHAKGIAHDAAEGVTHKAGDLARGATEAVAHAKDTVQGAVGTGKEALRSKLVGPASGDKDQEKR